MGKAEQAVVALRALGHDDLVAGRDTDVLNTFGRWTERTTTCICRETVWVRFSDGSRICSADGDPWEVAVPLRQQQRERRQRGAEEG